MKWNDGMELCGANGEQSLNERFLESDIIDDLIKQMDEIIVDKYCNNFYENILELT